LNGRFSIVRDRWCHVEPLLPAVIRRSAIWIRWIRVRWTGEAGLFVEPAVTSYPFGIRAWIAGVTGVAGVESLATRAAGKIAFASVSARLAAREVALAARTSGVIAVSAGKVTLTSGTSGASRKISLASETRVSAARIIAFTSWDVDSGDKVPARRRAARPESGPIHKAVAGVAQLRVRTGVLAYLLGHHLAVGSLTEGAIRHREVGALLLVGHHVAHLLGHFEVPADRSLLALVFIVGKAMLIIDGFQFALADG